MAVICSRRLHAENTVDKLKKIARMKAEVFHEHFSHFKPKKVGFFPHILLLYDYADLLWLHQLNVFGH